MHDHRGRLQGKPLSPFLAGAQWPWALEGHLRWHLAHPRRLVLAQSKTLCMAVTPSRPMGATSPPVMMA